MLLLVLAGNFVILIVGWAFVGFASYALISFWYRRRTATYAGMKAFVINVVGDVGLVLAAILIQRDTGALDFDGVFARAGDTWTAERVDDRRDLPADPGRRVREVGADPAPHLAAGRDGGPDAGLRPDPRRHDGDRRRLPDRAHVPALRAGADRRRHLRRDRRAHARVRGVGRARRHRPQADHRLLDHQPDRLHDHGRLDRRLQRRACSTS